MQFNRKVYVLLFTVIAFILLSVTPAMAQDGLTTTIPGDGDNLIIMQEWTWNGILFIAAALLALFGGTIFAVYRSAPPWLRPLLEAALQAGIRQVDDYVDTSENKIDDVLWREGIRKQFEQHGLIEPPFIEKDPPDPFQPLG